ncbi:hypothetical protein CR513_53564, partial [Mucuna pruriens]
MGDRAFPSYFIYNGIYKWKRDIEIMDFTLALLITLVENNATEKIDNLAHLFPIRLHGISTNIVLNRDLKFISRFWEVLYRAFETKLS